MAGCKLTGSLDAQRCQYATAGANTLYLANYYPPVVASATAAGVIGYTFDNDGEITNIYLPSGEVFYKVQAEQNTLSYVDALLESGNGGKYRQHTVNAVLNKYDADVLNEGNSLSLGKFIAIIVDNAGRIVVLGRTSGLSAPAGGFDFNSGAAAADATGWTIILQGVSMEIAPLITALSVITPIDPTVITP